MNATQKTLKALQTIFPALLSVLLLVSLATVALPDSFYSNAFPGGAFDLAAGSLLGSVAAGNPSTSYVLAGELVDKGVGLAAVTAFLVAWVTVGVIQFPAETMLLGKRFALTRNLVALASSIAVAVLTVATTGALS